jgi:hypothetical protein
MPLLLSLLAIITSSQTNNSQNNKNAKVYGKLTLNGIRECLIENKYRKNILQVLYENSSIAKPSMFLRSCGMIYAIVHLPSSSVYITASSKRLDVSLKQHWYGSHLWNTRFHRLIGKGSIRNVLVWPLGAILPDTKLSVQKQFWIDKIFRKSSRKYIWRPKLNPQKPGNLEDPPTNSSTQQSLMKHDTPQTPPHILHSEEDLCISPCMSNPIRVVFQKENHSAGTTVDSKPESHLAQEEIKLMQRTPDSQTRCCATRRKGS